MTKAKYRIAFLIDYLNSEYSAFVLRGIQTACKQLDMDLLIFPIAELHDIQSSYNYQLLATTALLTKKNIDGIIIPAGTQLRYLSREELSEYLKNYKDIPIVSIGCDLSEIPSVQVDCEKAYKALIDYLVDGQNCTKFGIMGSRGKSPEAIIRTENILKALESRGIAKKSVKVWNANFDFNSAAEELKDYYERNNSLDFDAILCLNDEMVYAAVDFCRKIGKRIPEDILIAGFDNIERDSFSQPSITSIDQSILEQGFEAVKAMKHILETGTNPEMKTVEAKVYCRESTDRNPLAKKETTDYLKFDIDEFRNSSKYTATEWFFKKFQLYKMTNFYTEMQMDIPSEELKNRLNNDFRSFGMKAAAVVLYERPVIQKTPFDNFEMPKKVSIFTAFDDKTGYDSTKTLSKLTSFRAYNPALNIVPKNTLEISSDGIYVSTIFRGEVQYGYFMFQAGEYDIAIYDMFMKVLSSVIDNLISYKEVEDEKNLLRNKYFQLDKEVCSDELTGLNNRRGLLIFGQALLDVGKAMEQSGLIIFGDMDGLKKINDTYGHEQGDRAILAESKILKKNLRSNDVVARIGGDEFAMVCPGLTVPAFEKIKNHIVEDCKTWTDNNETGFTLSISLGYSEYPSRLARYNLSKLLSEADNVLYKEKRRKKELNR